MVRRHCILDLIVKARASAGASLAAEIEVLTAGASGSCLAQRFEKTGIAPQIQPKAVLVGPVPAEIQNLTVHAGVVSATARVAAAVLKGKGMETP